MQSPNTPASPLVLLRLTPEQPLQVFQNKYFKVPSLAVFAHVMAGYKVKVGYRHYIESPREWPHGEITGSGVDGTFKDWLLPPCADVVAELTEWPAGIDQRLVGAYVGMNGSGV